MLYRGEVEPGSVVIEGANILELVRLVIIVDADPTTLPGFLALFQGGIVKLAMDLQGAIKGVTLCLVGVQAIFVRTKQWASPIVGAMPGCSIRRWLSWSDQCLEPTISNRSLLEWTVKA